MRTNLRIKANKAKQFRCKDFIIVLENPKNLQNIGTVLLNIDALGAEKLYVVDGHNILPEHWAQMRERSKLNDISASAVKWVFIKKFKTTQECIDHLNKKKFRSLSTSPHQAKICNVVLNEGTYTAPRLAVWFGNEARGLSEEVFSYVDANITIPVCGIIESLNLGTSTGIVIHEIANQRRAFSEARREKSRGARRASWSTNPEMTY